MCTCRCHLSASLFDWPATVCLMLPASVRCQARSPHIALALQCGILPALLASLRSPHERLQLEAAWILTCIATGPIHQLLAAGTHKELIHLLRAKGQFDVCQQCIWALGNIIGDSIESKNRILQENFIPLLMEHITRSFNERKLVSVPNACV